VTDLPYVHIGLMVPRLEPAIAEYERFGVSFMEPRTVHVDRLVDETGEGEIDLRIVFSRQGPPHWELLEAAGGGIYGPQHVGGLHHVAVLHPDPERRSEELVGQGMRCTARQYRPDGSMIVAYLESDGLHGIRVELIHAPVQETILAWIEGRDASP
jgi:hypothetical protein